MNNNTYPVLRKHYNISSVSCYYPIEYNTVFSQYSLMYSTV